MLLEVEGRGGRVRSRDWFGRELGQAEVEDFGVAAIRDKEVRGLNVAMNDSFAVCGIEPVGDLDASREQSFQFHGTPGHAVLQRGAFQKLQRNERFLVLFTDVIDRADVGMIQCGCGFGFTPKALQSLAVLRKVFRKEFQCNKSVQAGVLGLVDHTHAPAAEFFEDTVVGDGLSD
jgi:hypothetical protein